MSTAGPTMNYTVLTFAPAAFAKLVVGCDGTRDSGKPSLASPSKLEFVVMNEHDRHPMVLDVKPLPVGCAGFRQWPPPLGVGLLRQPCRV